MGNQNSGRMCPGWSILPGPARPGQLVLSLCAPAGPLPGLASGLPTCSCLQKISNWLRCSTTNCQQMSQRACWPKGARIRQDTEGLQATGWKGWPVQSLVLLWPCFGESTWKNKTQMGLIRYLQSIINQPFLDKMLLKSPSLKYLGLLIFKTSTQLLSLNFSFSASE